ncbi:MAG TPA: hypothetical protein VFT22_23045 [Kofleriaceae bacterium]|nr:hypothetical protein [Kofleriaceae bacterium]
MPSAWHDDRQFLPVAVGRGLRWPAAAHASFGAHVLGAACFNRPP